jgi:myosin-5
MDVGARVWVSDPKDGWTLGTVAGRSKSGEFVVTLKNSGDDASKRQSEVCAIMGSEPGSLKSIEDLTRLPALHEAALLQALQERFDSDQIYTWVGPILIAVNPFKKIPNLYQTKRFIAQEKNLPPHVYGLANATFRAMVDYNGQNQSILVSGESGAGKTETTKHAMQYLTEVSGGGSGGNKSDVSTRILQANPLLEAFGNAKTIRNDNSSRFGKLIEMKFAHQGRHKLIGAGVTSYLLEKARVVHQARGERNYHIFYELFANGSQASKFRLTSPKQHRYLNGEF